MSAFRFIVIFPRGLGEHKDQKRTLAVCPSCGMVEEVWPRPIAYCEHSTERGHPQRQRYSVSLPIQFQWKPVPGPSISCVKTTNRVTPVPSLIRIKGQQLLI